MEENKEKNEFFNYEKCLEIGNYSKSYLNDVPAVVLSIIDGTRHIINSKNNTFFE